MNMLKEMTPIEIFHRINYDVGMDIADVDGSDVRINADCDFLGNAVYFHDFLFCADAIYSYINQDKVTCDKPYFCTNSYPMEEGSDTFPDCKCFNPDGLHGHYCYEFDPDTGLRKFDEEILKSIVEGLKKAFKVSEQRSNLVITDEVEFMDI